MLTGGQAYGFRLQRKYTSKPALGTAPATADGYLRIKDFFGKELMRDISGREDKREHDSRRINAPVARPFSTQ